MTDYRILVVMTYGRAGSKLFHSFLDWHPQILSFPRTLQFNQFWKEIGRKKKEGEEAVDIFIRRHPRFFSGKTWNNVNNQYDRADQLGLNRDETFTVDTALFKKFVREELAGREVTRASLFIALHVAYHRACGRVIPKNPVILYHIHAVECSEDLRACVSDFPKRTYLLLITRNPVSSLKSVVAVMKMRNNSACGQLFFQHKRILKNISHFEPLLPELDARHLTYEHLMLRHREVMEAFVKWIGIDWNDSLMLSTMHGKLWWGNGKMPRNGIMPGSYANKPFSFLEKKDRLVFKRLIFNRLQALGYISEDEGRGVPGRSGSLSSLFLPTAAEWLILRSICSPAYWTAVNRKFREDVRVFGLNKAYVYRSLLVHIRVFNPVKWFYYFLARIIYYYGFAVTNKGKTEKTLELLIPAGRDAGCK